MYNMDLHLHLDMGLGLCGIGIVWCVGLVGSLVLAIAILANTLHDTYTICMYNMEYAYSIQLYTHLHIVSIKLLCLSLSLSSLVYSY